LALESSCAYTYTIYAALPIARSGATVIRLLCDPLPIQNVLKYRTRSSFWEQ
jgi:hypothetical protein